MARPHALAAALFAALAAAMTWPLAANLGSAVAWPGDPFINIWILDWDWWATFHQPLSLFQANAFYPAKLPLAYSENLYGIAVVLFPFRALGMPPIVFFGINIPAVLAWASAHVLPGVLAISALHEYAGLPHHQHIGKHLWMLAVFASTIIAFGVWMLRRRRIGKASSDQARTGLRPGAGPT